MGLLQPTVPSPAHALWRCGNDRGQTDGVCCLGPKLCAGGSPVAPHPIARLPMAPQPMAPQPMAQRAPEAGHQPPLLGYKSSSSFCP